MYRLFLSLMILAVMLTGCGGNTTPSTTITLPQSATVMPPSTPVPPLPTYTPLPTYAPLPTYTPLPTYIPLPTYTPVAPVTSNAVDLAQNTALAEAVNNYRIANGQKALNILYHLAYVAASRVQITMIPGVDLNTAQIDPKVMPPNYSWYESSFGGDDSLALSINTPQAVLEYLTKQQNESSWLLDPKYRDIGAALLCNGQRCGYVVILGNSLP